MKQFRGIKFVFISALFFGASIVSGGDDGYPNVLTSDQMVNIEKPVVKFFLYTRSNTDEKELFLFDSVTLKNSPFNKSRPTKFITHGYLDNYKKPMPQMLKDRLLSAEDVNVIIVDWSKIAMSPNYFWIVGHVSSVGSYLARMVEFLVSMGGGMKSIHLIGHSLGAHVSGAAGASLQGGKIYRITGLDPAGPTFSKAKPDNRLDPSDAEFVDVIHTCGGLLGLEEPLGHADFYPNGGKNIQPGCHFFDFGRCSHLRSYEFFSESLINDHTFPTILCTSNKNMPQNCTSSHVQMGYYVSPSTRGIFFVTTNGNFPFAPHHP